MTAYFYLRKLLLFFPLLFLLQGYTQEIKEKQYIHRFDSLKALKINESEVNSLLNLANEKLYTGFNLPEKVLDHVIVITRDSLKTYHAKAFKMKGILYDNNDRIKESLDFYLKAMDIYEGIGEKSNAARCLANIGILHMERLGNQEKAREYFLEAKSVFTTEGDLSALPTIIGVIGITYFNEKKYEKALSWFEKALEGYKEHVPDNDYSNILMNIANCHFYLKNYDQVLEPYESLIRLSKERGEGTHQRLHIYNNLTLFLSEIDQTQESLKVLNEVYEEIKNLNIYSRYTEKFYKNYSSILKQTGQYEKSLKMLYAHLNIRDSLEVLKREDLFSELSTKFETEKKELEIENLNALNKIEEEKRIAEEEKVIYLQIGGGGLLLLIIFIGIGLKQKINDNKKITQQKRALVKKNDEIMDSITYAKRLQDAILPSQKIVKSFLMDSFILYKPKDIVAGDFYFMDIVEEQHKKLIYYVAADCTGHGVPGAMVSIVGANGLKQCIQEYELRSPGAILDKLTEIVSKNFSQSEEKIRDGMDLALCCLEFEHNEVKRVHYAGANNPLWVLNTNRKKIPESAKVFKEGGGFEIKANKQAIGYTENINSFDTHSFEVEEGDTLYTFSDGYSDQFGGEKGKKLKSANFRKILFEIQEKNMQQQLSVIDERFENWKGNLEQVDDVCVIGVRL